MSPRFSILYFPCFAAEALDSNGLGERSKQIDSSAAYSPELSPISAE